MRNLLLVGISFCLLATNTFSAEFPDALLDKVNELRATAEAKKELPKNLEGIKVVDFAESQKMLKGKKVIFLDTRVKTQYDTEKIPGATWFLTDDLLKDPALADKLDKNKEYLLYCNGVYCWRSPGAGLLLAHLGFKKLYWYRDGIPDWKNRGGKTE